MVLSNAQWFAASSVELDFTNMTTGAAASIAFDGVTVAAWNSATQVQQNGAPPGAYTYYIGKDWGSGKTKVVATWKAYGTSDLGLLGAGGTITVKSKLQGSDDDISYADLGSEDSETDTGGIILTQTSGLGTTAYRYHRLIFRHERSGETPTNIGVVEVEFTF
jgi:hypothetical protein